MKRMSGWESTQARDGSVERLPAGAYVCGIVSARAGLTRNNTEMLVLDIDIAEGQYRGIFNRKNESRAKYGRSTSWPASLYQPTENADGSPNEFYKGLITAIEESNPGYVWNFDETTLRGKMIGIVFQEEEFLALDGSGTIQTSTKPRWARTVDAVRKGDIPAPPIKKLTVGPAQGFAPANDELPWK